MISHLLFKLMKDHLVQFPSIVCSSNPKMYAQILDSVHIMELRMQGKGFYSKSIVIRYICLSSILQMKPIWIHSCSAGMETVIGNGDNAACTFCEMIAFWIQVQLKEHKAKEKVFQYVNEVISFKHHQLCSSGT